MDCTNDATSIYIQFDYLPGGGVVDVVEVPYPAQGQRESLQYQMLHCLLVMLTPALSSYSIQVDFLSL